MTNTLAARMASTLTLAQAAEAGLTVSEIVEAKLDEMSVILRETSPTTPVEQHHVEWLTAELAKGWPAAVLAGLREFAPDVEAGETCGQYGKRLVLVLSAEAGR
jgi:hypothetical protein